MVTSKLSCPASGRSPMTLGPVQGSRRKPGGAAGKASGATSAACATVKRS